MSAIIRRPQVRKLTGLSDRTIDRKEQAGDFPARVRLSVNAIGWYETEVFEWLASLQRGGGITPEAAIDARKAG